MTTAIARIITAAQVGRIAVAGFIIAAVELLGRSYLHQEPISGSAAVAFGAVGLGIAVVLTAGKIVDQKLHSRANKPLPVFLAVMGVANVVAQRGFTTQAVGPIIVIVLAISAGALALRGIPQRGVRA